MIITEKEKSKVVGKTLSQAQDRALGHYWDLSQGYDRFSHERLLGKRFYANTDG